MVAFSLSRIFSQPKARLITILQQDYAYTMPRSLQICRLRTSCMNSRIALAQNHNVAHFSRGFTLIHPVPSQRHHFSILLNLELMAFLTVCSSRYGYGTGRVLAMRTFLHSKTASSPRSMVPTFLAIRGHGLSWSDGFLTRVKKAEPRTFPFSFSHIELLSKVLNLPPCDPIKYPPSPSSLSPSPHLISHQHTKLPKTSSSKVTQPKNTSQPSKQQLRPSHPNLTNRNPQWATAAQKSPKN